MLHRFYVLRSYCYNFHLYDVVSSTPMRPTIGGVVPVSVSCLDSCLSLTSAIISIVCVHAFNCGLRSSMVPFRDVISVVAFATWVRNSEFCSTSSSRSSEVVVASMRAIACVVLS